MKLLVAGLAAAGGGILNQREWRSLTDKLRCELEANRMLFEKQKQELETERKCSEELKEAMQMAMEGHARILEQYADLEEKHINMLIRQRRIQDGIEEVKKAGRGRFRDEIKGLQEQLRDTAVQAGGELLVRLKEAEEDLAAAQGFHCSIDKLFSLAHSYQFGYIAMKPTMPNLPPETQVITRLQSQLQAHEDKIESISSQMKEMSKLLTELPKSMEQTMAKML
ncbi:hypothetical protein LXL04_004095 [Taraxacum kok-saghyz]